MCVSTDEDWLIEGHSYSTRSASISECMRTIEQKLFQFAEKNNEAHSRDKASNCMNRNMNENWMN